MNRADSVVSEARRALALVGLALRGALRSRLLVVAMVAGLALLWFAASAETLAPEDQLRVVRAGLIRAIAGFVAFFAIFVAAFAVPADLESRRVLSVLSKPLSRAGYIAGLFLGMAAVAGALTLGLGVLGALMLGRVARDAPEASRGLRPRVLPIAGTAWGTHRERRSVTTGWPEAVLTDDDEAGYWAGFAPAPTAEAPAAEDRTADGTPTGTELELRIFLRVKRGRDLLPREYATLTLTSGDATVRRSIELNDRVRLRLPVPGAFVRDGFTVRIAAKTSPYALIVRPDSVALLKPPVGEFPGYAAAVCEQYLQVLVLIAGVLLASTVFSPFTAVLTGLFVWLVAVMAPKVPQTIELFLRSASHAERRAAVAGTTPAAGVELGRQWFSGWLGDGLVTLTRLVPHFEQFGVARAYVLGYDPAPAALAGALGTYGFWSVLFVGAASCCFSFRRVS